MKCICSLFGKDIRVCLNPFVIGESRANIVVPRFSTRRHLLIKLFFWKSLLTIPRIRNIFSCNVKKATPSRAVRVIVLAYLKLLIYIRLCQLHSFRVPLSFSPLLRLKLIDFRQNQYNPTVLPFRRNSLL